MIGSKKVMPWLLLASAAAIPILFAQSESEKGKPAPAKTTKHFMTALDQAKWTPPPEGMIRGTPSVEGGGTLRYALISGDPMKPGAAFTIRLACSDGYKVAPHWHPTDENMVVLTGTFAVGPGDTFDTAGLQDTPTGGYIFMPRRMHHFGLCKGETDVLIYGTGPFQSIFLGAPEGGKAKSSRR